VQRASGTALSIIAGGKGSRLGGVAKGLLQVNGRTVLERQLSLAPLFDEVLLVTNDPAPYASYGLRAVGDLVPGKGAPGGVHAALVAARSPWVLVLACDMPFVTEPVVRTLLDARDSQTDAVCFQVKGRVEPLLGVYRATLAERWGPALHAEPSLRQLLQLARARVLPEEALRAVDPGLEAVQGLNSPEDLARFGGLLPPGRPGA
jgi:molybdopterin-guanine dinucleotide biosynthesis protein A